MFRVECDAFDYDVDVAPMAQTMFKAIYHPQSDYDKWVPSYDLDILSEVHDHDHYQDAVCEHHEEHEMHVQPNYVVDSHANYTSDKQVKLYEIRAMFELTEKEQKIDGQLRIVITDRNIKEEKLKKELHSVKMQLASTINHNKLMVEEVTSLKKDFKQKENKYLEEFLDMKALKEKVAIGYKNPLCLTRAKQVQPALYNGYEIIKNNHVPALVHNTKDTLGIAEITRTKMNDKMKDSCNLIKMKEEALKKQTTASRPIKALTVVETLREIVEEAKVERPFDRSLASACLYTKHSHELLEYAIGTCPKAFNQRDKKHAPTPVIRKKQVTFKEQCDMSNSNTHKHVEQLNTQKTNVHVPPSTGVNCCTNASGSQPRSNTKKNRISPAKGVNKKKVEEHARINKSNLRTTDRVDSSSSSKSTVINSNSDSACQTCNKCLIYANHDVCVVDYLQSVKASPFIHNIYNVVRKVKQVWKLKQVRQVWKPTGKVLTSVGHQWRPTGKIFTLGEQCPLTRLTKPKVAPAKQNENQTINCANQQKPNQNWGSKFPNSLSLPVFKCMSYISSFGIWTQAIQNI
ncbi:hypothetical protein Tco_0900172 [Tanacetum coccineum]